jgi:hypothetical protein
MKLKNEKRAWELAWQVLERGSTFACPGWFRRLLIGAVLQLSAAAASLLIRSGRHSSLTEERDGTAQQPPKPDYPSWLLAHRHRSDCFSVRLSQRSEATILVNLDFYPLYMPLLYHTTEQARPRTGAISQTVQ